MPLSKRLASITPSCLGHKAMSSLICVAVLGMAAGCSGLTPVSRPEEPFPSIYQGYREYLNDPQTLVTYNQHPTREARNKIIYNMIAYIDNVYGEFQDQMSISRRNIHFLSDVTDAGLAAAITIVGGAHAKSVLGALSGALKTSTLSIDNNYYEGQVTSALINAMDAQRLAEKTRIFNAMASDVGDYSLDAAIIDIGNYLRAGTLNSGLKELNKQASNAKDINKKGLDAAKAQLMKTTALPDMR